MDQYMKSSDIDRLRWIDINFQTKQEYFILSPTKINKSSSFGLPTPSPFLI